MCKDLTANEAKKHRSGICITPFCSNHVKTVKRNGRTYVPLRCSACARADWALRNPEKYLYANLRGNARRRGKVFTITFEEFKAFLESENYLRRKRGRSKTSVSVDRVINELGYIAGNLKAITLQANSSKRHYVDYWRRLEEQHYSYEEDEKKYFRGIVVITQKCICLSYHYKNYEQY